MNTVAKKECIRCLKIKSISSFTKYKKNKLYFSKISKVCYSCHYGVQKGERKFLWKYANTRQRNKHTKELLERRIIKKDGCWMWNGTINKHGYGEIHLNNKHHNSSRVAWMVYKGDIPKGMYVLHACDNRECCNPDHLFLGTAQDNMLDMIKKGRSRFLKGDECPWSKINEKTVIEILADLRKEIDTREISKKFNIPVKYISEIKVGKKWGHVGNRIGIKINEPRKIVLTEQAVREIKEKFKYGARIRAISKEYNINETTIADIKHNRTWKHVLIQ